MPKGSASRWESGITIVVLMFGTSLIMTSIIVDPKPLINPGQNAVGTSALHPELTYSVGTKR
jgi:hypothetical protein